MLEIRQVPLGGGLRDFLDVVDYIYRDDPNYIRPLDFDMKERLNPKKNPFFEHAEAVLFTAHRNGKCVGRVSAQVDQEHLARHKDDTGFFGFLDTVDDPEVAKALLARAEDWLREKGMKRVRGPLSLSINEELGCLVEGFDTPPYVYMPHHRSYQAGLIDQAGYSKVKDVFAWHYEVGELNARTRKAQREIAALPEVTARRISMKDIEKDLELMVEMFNDAWSDNWGFVPLTHAEIVKIAKDFKLIIEPEITRLVFIDGQPAAFAIAVPNLNDIIRDLGGKLLPFGAAKVLYRLKVTGPRQGRLSWLGIRKQYRNIRKYAGLSAYLYAEMNDSGKRVGIKSGELSWTLEDNGAINAGVRLMGARIYKKYRVWEKPLGGQAKAAA